MFRETTKKCQQISRAAEQLMERIKTMTATSAEQVHRLKIKKGREQNRDRLCKYAGRMVMWKTAWKAGSKKILSPRAKRACKEEDDSTASYDSIADLFTLKTGPSCLQWIRSPGSEKGALWEMFRQELWSGGRRCILQSLAY